MPEFLTEDDVVMLILMLGYMKREAMKGNSKVCAKRCDLISKKLVRKLEDDESKFRELYNNHND